MTTGLVIGKFLPPHRGHLHLVERARAACDRLVVVVCSLAAEPIPGEKRFEWMRELCPGCDVRHLAAELPQEPQDHPRFWELWTEALRPFGRPDVVFTSEDYGDELARRLGARHACVDRGREAFPVSGRAVRADPMKQWEFLPPPVRAHYAKRVVIYGAESTGKTTLAERLAKEFGTVWVPEWARGYLDRMGRFVVPEDFPAIARGQMESEDAAARQANRVVICDTDLLTTWVYAERYAGSCPEWIQREAMRRRYDVYLSVGTDVPFVADWQRETAAARDALHAKFREKLFAKGTPFVEISGEWDQRFARAAAAIRNVLALRP